MSEEQATAQEIVTEWLGLFDPPPQIDFQQSEFLQQAIAAALAAQSAAPVGEPSHIMCVGWPTIKRLAAGEAVWFESLECGAVAADDLHGADIDAMLALSSAKNQDQSK